MKMITIVTAILLGTTAVGAKQVCSTKPDPTAYSAWRIINGRQCWYQGKRGMARENLYWAAHRRPLVAHSPKTGGVVPLPRPKPTGSPPPDNTEDLESRLNYAFGVLALQNALQLPSGALPLALVGPWLGLPLTPGLQPVPPPPAGWEPPKPAAPGWWGQLWQRVLQWFAKVWS